MLCVAASTVWADCQRALTRHALLLRPARPPQLSGVVANAAVASSAESWYLSGSRSVS